MLLATCSIVTVEPLIKLRRVDEILLGEPLWDNQDLEDEEEEDAVNGNDDQNEVAE
jgi:hypothetical protein